MRICDENWLPQTGNQPSNGQQVGGQVRSYLYQSKRVVLVAVVYCIWKERNLGTFQNKARQTSAIWLEITELVRSELLGYQVKGTHENVLIRNT